MHIGDLPDNVLGLAGPDFIGIDIDAAGSGWFIDATPADDFEFLSVGDHELMALGFSSAFGKMDLLTVVTHEMGHLLGLEHSHDENAMAESLDTGVRMLPELEHDEEHADDEAPVAVAGQLVATVSSASEGLVPWFSSMTILGEEKTRWNASGVNVFGSDKEDETGLGWRYEVDDLAPKFSVRIEGELAPTSLQPASRNDAVDLLLAIDDYVSKLPIAPLLEALDFEAADRLLEEFLVS